MCFVEEAQRLDQVSRVCKYIHLLVPFCFSIETLTCLTHSSVLEMDTLKTSKPQSIGRKRLKRLLL